MTTTHELIVVVFINPVVVFLSFKRQRSLLKTLISLPKATMKHSSVHRHMSSGSSSSCSC
uniref:Uncharacterized protein n=1 Tax=Octopus bimaculoides TaxID=37653 RepID=A0A0L8FGI9_OCTBM